MRSAIAVARGEWLMMVPADLAMDLTQIPRYLAASADADVVLGVCPVRSDYTAYRYFLSRTNVWLLRTLFHLPYHQFNYVNPWPRPIQSPHPPIWIPSQGSSSTIRWAAAMRYTYAQTLSPICTLSTISA